MHDTDTGWRASRLDRTRASHRLMFGRMYEDSSIERAAFVPGTRVFCVASAGCTALALAERHVVTAVDISAAQIEYVRTRLRGAIPRRGDAEALMSLGRRTLAVMGWRRPLLHAFVNLEDGAEQTRFWRAHLDSPVLRVASDALLSRRVLRVMLPREFADAAPSDFGARLRARFARCIASYPNRYNPYVRALLLGELAPAIDSSRAPTLELEVAEATDYLQQAAPRSFGGFALSNIVDGAKASFRDRLFAAVQRAARPGAVVVLRSFREAPEKSPFDRAEHDRSVLWGRVEVVPAEALQNLEW